MGSLLLVEPNDVTRGLLEATAAQLAPVESHRTFESARARLSRAPFEFLVTNVRLGAHNGLHLVYLSCAGDGAPRAIVYTDQRDPGLAHEVQRAGAFYDVAACLPVTLAAFVRGTLPSRDRRDPATTDRRQQIRGGRRCWDLHLKGSENPSDSAGRQRPDVPGAPERA
jgi:DNA-binding NtrC family response regulator